MKGKLNGLSLFTGYAGIDLALRDYIRPVGYCDIEQYSHATLLSRFDDGSIPFAPIWTDVRKVDGRKLRGVVDVITGGFPCQDISVAGNGKGLEGERSGLFFEIARLAEEIAPSLLVLENVPAIRTRGDETVQKTLAELGYDARWTTLSASQVGANHKRERWFCVAAHTERFQLRDESWWRGWQNGKGKAITRNDGKKESVADTDSANVGGCGISGRSSPELSVNSVIGYGGAQKGKSDWWSVEPDICRVANGVAFRVDRIKALGNGVVPLQVKTAFEALMGITR